MKTKGEISKGSSLTNFDNIKENSAHLHLH